MGLRIGKTEKDGKIPFIIEGTEWVGHIQFAFTTLWSDFDIRVIRRSSRCRPSTSTSFSTLVQWDEY
jgi:hypothetical protein